MCDYSLFEYRSRLAVVGEDLVAYRFPRGSLGLTSPGELKRCAAVVKGWRKWFYAPETPCAVCVPPGARLMLNDIPPTQQSGFLVSEEEVTFVQIGMDPNRHRDAVRFKSGRELMLQHFKEGQRVRVLALVPEQFSAVSEREIAQLLAENV